MNKFMQGLRNITPFQKKMLVAVVIVGIIGTYMMRGQDVGKVLMLLGYLIIAVFQLIKIANTSISAGTTYGQVGAASSTLRNSWEIYAPLWALTGVLLVVDILSGLRLALALNPLSLGLFAWLPGVMISRWVNRSQAGSLLRDANTSSASGQAVAGQAVSVERDYTSAPRPAETPPAPTVEAVTLDSAPRPPRKKP